jgi:hypothetical protein
MSFKVSRIPNFSDLFDDWDEFIEDMKSFGATEKILKYLDESKDLRAPDAVNELPYILSIAYENENQNVLAMLLNACVDIRDWLREERKTGLQAIRPVAESGDKNLLLRVLTSLFGMCESIGILEGALRAIVGPEFDEMVREAMKIKDISVNPRSLEITGWK